MKLSRIGVWGCVFVAAACDVPPSYVAEHGERRLAATGPCGVVVSKVDYDQPGADDGSREVVELYAPGATPGQTLGDCGVSFVTPWDGAACERESASRAVDVSKLVVPASLRVVVTRSNASVKGDATAPLKSGAWLENGPDLIVLEGVDGPLYAVRYGGPTTCAPAANVEDAGEDAETTSGPDHWLVRCGDDWTRVPRDESTLRAEASCGEPAGAGGTSGAGGAPTAGGAAGESTDGGPTASDGSAAADASESGDAGDAATPLSRCSARISKLDVVQRGQERDANEAVEIEVLGAPPAGATLGDCGIERLVFVNANSELTGCGPLAGPYAEARVGGLTIPGARRLVIGNRADADARLSQEGRHDVVQDGPDYATLESVDGTRVDAVAYASESGARATCAIDATNAPADPPAVVNRVLVRCDGAPERFLAAPEPLVVWRAPVACPPQGYPDDAAAPAPTPPTASTPSAPAPSASAPAAKTRQSAVVEEAPGGCAVTQRRGWVPTWPLSLVAWWWHRATRRRARQGLVH